MAGFNVRIQKCLHLFHVEMACLAMDRRGQLMGTCRYYDAGIVFVIIYTWFANE